VETEKLGVKEKVDTHTPSVNEVPLSEYSLITKDIIAVLLVDIAAKLRSALKTAHLTAGAQTCITRIQAKNYRYFASLGYFHC